MQDLKDDPLKVTRKTPQTKAEITDSTVRAILKEESDERTLRTRKLREARLAMEAKAAKVAAAEAAAAASAPAKRKPAARKTRKAAA